MRGQALDSNDSGRGDRAAALAEAFDRTFAAAPATAIDEWVDLLAVRLGGDPFAVQLGETAGLFGDRKITPVPTAVAEFCGIAGLRGSIVPVYDLGALVGYPPASSQRWLVLAREAAVALAFEAFDGQLRVERQALIAHESQREHIREVARQGGQSWPIIHLPSVLAAIRARMPADG